MYGQALSSPGVVVVVAALKEFALVRNRYLPRANAASAGIVAHWTGRSRASQYNVIALEWDMRTTWLSL